MRVSAVPLALALALFLAFTRPTPTCAEAPTRPPPPLRSLATAPAARARVALEGAHLAFENVRGVAGSITVEGALTPHRHLELGASLDVRGHDLGALDASRGASRFGLGALALFVGTGAVLDERWSFGVRLRGGIGARLLDLRRADGGAPLVALSLEPSVAFHAPWVTCALSLDAGMLYDEGSPGHHVGMPVAGGEVAAAFGSWLVRPLVAFELRGTDRALGARASGGVLWQPAAHLAFRFTLDAAWPDDPEGRVVGLSLSLLRLPKRP